MALDGHRVLHRPPVFYTIGRLGLWGNSVGVFYLRRDAIRSRGILPGFRPKNTSWPFDLITTIVCLHRDVLTVLNYKYFVFRDEEIS